MSESFTGFIYFRCVLTHENRFGRMKTQSFTHNLDIASSFLEETQHTIEKKECEIEGIKEITESKDWLFNAGNIQIMTFLLLKLSLTGSSCDLSRNISKYDEFEKKKNTATSILVKSLCWVLPSGTLETIPMARRFFNVEVPTKLNVEDPTKLSEFI